MERRLAAIMAADAVGYSRLMGLDEEGLGGGAADEGIEIDVSTDASYTVSGNTVSAFQRAQTLMSETLRHDISLKHPVSCAVKTAVTWGA